MKTRITKQLTNFHEHFPEMKSKLYYLLLNVIDDHNTHAIFNKIAFTKLLLCIFAKKFKLNLRKEAKSLKVMDPKKYFDIIRNTENFKEIFLYK